MSVLVMSLWWGQTALAQSGVLSAVIGVSALSLACLGSGVLLRVIEPNSIPDEEMGTLTSRLVGMVLGVGTVAGVLGVAVQFL